MAVAVAASVVGVAAAPARAQSIHDVFEKVKASVVVIRARGQEVTSRGLSRFTEIGSGVLVSKDGQVMTAAHVVHAMDEIKVEFFGSETVSARVVASEPAADLSLLQLDHVPPDAVVAPMADSDTIHIGDEVIIVGAPYGLAYSLSQGYISARWAPNTVYRSMPLAEFFQTDAVINTGNSGGPMFSRKGEVVGIVSHNISKSGGSEGLGFVVTLNTAKKLLLERRSFWSGLEGILMSDELADLLNVPNRASGYLVKTVAKNSPAESLGLRPATQVVRISGQEVPLGGDIVLSVEGIAVSTQNIGRIRDALAGLASGAEFRVGVLRAGQVLELKGRLP